jgi:phosphoserine phosphatase
VGISAVKPASPELGRPRAIVCDVGHTIVMESVLNHVLSGLGQTGAVRVLYDRTVLDPDDEARTESWVDEVIREKVRAMHGVEVNWICQLATQVPLTPGFGQLLDLAKAEKVPVMLMGAVPRFVTEALVSRFSTAIANIVGTEVVIRDGRVDLATRVCTPLGKAGAVLRWLSEIGIAPNDAVVIGDSIGDLPAMRLVPKVNRVAFNTDDPAVLQVAGRSHSNAMYELSRELFK